MTHFEPRPRLQAVDQTVHQEVDREADAREDRELLPLAIYLKPRPPLRFAVRVGIFIVGWLLILVGVAGLVLPVLPGFVTILLGAALLSLDNVLVYRGLRRLFTRWPHLWYRIEKFRERSHDRIHGMFHRHGK